MAIESIKYEQDMLNSLKEVMGKLDLVINSVNKAPTSETINSVNNSIGVINTTLTSIKNDINNINSDISKIKTTLYTPITKSA